VLLLGGLLLAACGGAGSDVATPKTAPTDAAVQSSPASAKHKEKKCTSGTPRTRLKCLVPGVREVQVLGSGQNLDVTITVNSGAAMAPFGADSFAYKENERVVRAAAKVFGQRNVAGLSIIGTGEAADKYGNASTQPLWVWGTYEGHFAKFNLRVLEMKTLWEAADKSQILLS